MTPTTSGFLSTINLFRMNCAHHRVGMRVKNVGESDTVGFGALEDQRRPPWWRVVDGTVSLEFLPNND
jgi:hypothetical protein